MARCKRYRFRHIIIVCQRLDYRLRELLSQMSEEQLQTAYKILYAIAEEK